MKTTILSALLLAAIINPAKAQALRLGGISRYVIDRSTASSGGAFYDTLDQAVLSPDEGAFNVTIGPQNASLGLASVTNSFAYQNSTVAFSPTGMLISGSLGTSGAIAVAQTQHDTGIAYTNPLSFLKVDFAVDTPCHFKLDAHTILTGQGTILDWDRFAFVELYDSNFGTVIARFGVASSNSPGTYFSEAPNGMAEDVLSPGSYSFVAYVWRGSNFNSAASNTVGNGAFSGESFSSATLAITPIPITSNLDTWREIYFPGSTATTGDGADAATPQNDGVSNLIKFATAMDPRVAGKMPGEFTVSGGNLVFSYTPSPAAVSDAMSFAVEYSDTLEPGSWQTDIVNQGSIGAGGALVAATIPKGTASERFAHLKVTTP